MQKTLLSAKLHKATITACELQYQGSLSIDQALMDAAGMIPHEQVHVYNIHNAHRFTTYAIPAPRHSGVICANGACARLVNRHDHVIICTYALLNSDEITGFKPTVVLLDAQNRILPGSSKYRIKNR